MPIYEYRCSSCGTEFEELIKRGAESVRCPRCSSAEVERKLSLFGLKASGSSSCPTCSGGRCSTCK